MAKVDPIEKTSLLPSVVKFIRDPVHDLIRIEDDVILNLLGSRAMQRLRHIKQLGLACLVYPAAEHSRFTHSLGAYHLSGRLLNQLRITNKGDRLSVNVAALLHDIGHGPFSHQFERTLKEIGYQHSVDHEEWTIKIIDQDTEIQKALGKGLAGDVRELLLRIHKKKHLISIISSQFDADRLDYMLRDSHMTGAKYGMIDLNWMIRNLSLQPVTAIDEDLKKLNKKIRKIVVDGKRGLSSLENYLLGLFNMYQGVYFHRSVIAAECMITSIFRRAIDCIKNGKNVGVPWELELRKIARNQELTLENYMRLTDSLVYSWIISWARYSKDRVLRDLSNRLLSRRVFKAILLPENEPQRQNLRDSIIDDLKRRKMPKEYYFQIPEPKRVGYSNLFTSLDKRTFGQEIYVQLKGKEPEPFTKVGNNFEISKAILGLEIKRAYYVIPDETYAIVKQ